MKTMPFALGLALLIYGIVLIILNGFPPAPLVIVAMVIGALLIVVSAIAGRAAATKKRE